MARQRAHSRSSLGAPAREAVDFFLSAEGGAESRRDDIGFEAAAEASVDGGVDGRGRRLGVDQRADGIEEHGGGRHLASPANSPGAAGRRHGTRAGTRRQ